MTQVLCEEIIKLVDQLWWKDTLHSTGSVASFKDQIVSYDNEIITAGRIQSSLLAAVARLKVMRNQLVPINKLPLEILQMIFRCVSHTGRSIQATLAIYSTCSLWRIIALSDASLWTFLSAASLIQSDTSCDALSARSANHPITVSSDGWYALRGLRTKLADGVRLPLTITGIDLDFDDEADFNSYSDGLSPFPDVRNLSIRLDRDCKVEHDHPADIFLLSDIISKHLPPLHELNLVECRFPWDSAIYTGLTHLSIHLNGLGIRQWDDETDFLGVCRSSPNLRTLRLVIVPRTGQRLRSYEYERACDEWKEAHATPSTPFHMANLTNLTLDLPPMQLLHFFRYITFQAEGMDHFDVRSSPHAEPFRLEKLELTMRTLIRDYIPSRLLRGIQRFKLQASSGLQVLIEGEGHHATGQPYHFRVCDMPRLYNRDSAEDSAKIEKSDLDFGPAEIASCLPSLYECVVELELFHWHWYSDNADDAVDGLRQLTRHMVACIPIVTEFTILLTGWWSTALWDVLMERLNEAAKQVPPSLWNLKSLRVHNSNAESGYHDDTLALADGVGLKVVCKLLETLGCKLEELVIDCQDIVADSTEDALDFFDGIHRLNIGRVCWGSTDWVLIDDPEGFQKEGCKTVPSHYWRDITRR